MAVDDADNLGGPRSSTVRRFHVLPKRLLFAADRELLHLAVCAFLRQMEPGPIDGCGDVCVLRDVGVVAVLLIGY